MRLDRPAHEVVADHPDLLDALAVPIGTYLGVATARPIPHAPTFEATVPDLLAGLGKTEVLTRRRRIDNSLVAVWLRASRSIDCLSSAPTASPCRSGASCAGWGIA